MLSAEMSEGRTKTIELSDVTRADLLFFLRLLYTGQVDEADWDGLSGTPHFQVPWHGISGGPLGPDASTAEVTAPEDAEPASAALLNGIYTARGPSADLLTTFSALLND
ncbi:Pla2g12a [Symbiodinium sp. CCMP2592]|nr:Pla2g12a [Symbiodinium sp. CCMP2592]